MNIVADENIDIALVNALRWAGHNVVWITEASPSIDDYKVLSTAVAEGALLITEDKGFGDLVFNRNEATLGVLLLRIHDADFDQRATIVLDLLQSSATDILGNFSTLTDKGLRVRRLGR